MTAPYQPSPAIEPGSPAHRLLRGVLRVDAAHRYVRQIDLLATPGWTLSLVDTGDGDEVAPTGDLTIHVLWQLDEANASITVDGTPCPIAPGDTMSVPGGSRLARAGGMLLAQIEAASISLSHVLPPSHGEESFEGYNRRTTYETPNVFSLERWKITQPLTLSAREVPVTILDLAAPLGLVWRGGVDLIGRGECRVIAPETGVVTLLPDGLGYALVISD